MSLSQTEYYNVDSKMKVITATWVAETSGAFTSATITGCKGMYLIAAETIPNQGRAPTGNYDGTLSDSNSLGATALAVLTITNASATASEMWFPTQISRPLDTDLILAITGNSVDRATGQVKLYLSSTPIAVVAAA
jgi:hypothetical protein